MTHRIKKPAVKPELRREWLRRHDEEGQSPPEIAKADGYDVRTVRKQLEIERQERERREARSIVLRQALEKHYADMCCFVQKLDSHIVGAKGSPSTMRSDPMWSALEEHLPRSTIWKKLDRWERVWAEIDRVESALKEQLEKLIKARALIKFPSSPEETGLNLGIVQALAFHFGVTARGELGLDQLTDFKVAETSDRRTSLVELGAFTMGRVPGDRVAEIENLVIGLLAEITTWKEHGELGRLFDEMRRLQQELHEEFLVIMLRRVVPARCKYCPL